MAQRSRLKSARRQRCDSWKEGRSPLIIDLPLELQAVLELLAKDAGMTLSQLASIALEEQVMKKPMDDSLRKRVDQALKHNFKLIADSVCPTLAPRPGNKGRKTRPT